MDQMILELAAFKSNSSAAAATVTVTATASLASATGKSNSSNDDLGTKIGLAVGVPLGVLAIGVLSFLFWKERKRNNAGGGRVLEMDPSASYYEPQLPRKNEAGVGGMMGTGYGVGNEQIGGYGGGHEQMAGYGNGRGETGQMLGPSYGSDISQTTTTTTTVNAPSELGRGVERKSPRFGGPAGVHELI
jgi:hypothetical protein